MSYDAKDIHSLGDLEAIRMRPGMYIGDTSNPQQLFIEALDNAIDEVQSGYSEKAVVNIDTNRNLYSVRDYGRGIPHGKSHYKDLLGNDVEIETLQLVFTKNHSGGKFGGEVYKKSRGLHGIGLKAINSLSTHARAITFRKGKYVELVMSKGEVLDLRYGKVSDGNPLVEDEDSGGRPNCSSLPDPQNDTLAEDDGSNGTYVEFIPDPEIFEDPIIPLNSILTLSGISKAFGSNVEVYVDGVLQVLPYNDLFDLLPKSNDHENEFLTTSFHVDSPSTESIDIALRYTSDTNTLSRGYTNTIYNSSGGSHIRFFESCYKEAWQRFMKKDCGFKPEDTLVGLRAVVGVFINNDQMAFAGQTKERLTTRVNYFEQFRPKLVKSFRKYFNDNPAILKGLIKRFTEYRTNLEKMRASKELEETIYVSDSDDSGRVRRKSVVEKLRECSSKSREGTRLMIVEGDSAAGSILQARDVKYDAVLPLRGKILNVSGRTPNDSMKNEEVRSIVNAAGTGMLGDCDAGRSRYDQYLITCDKDSDGLNIAALVSSIFVNLLPDLVRKGMVYIVDPPLYSWIDHGQRKYTSDMSDIRDKSRMTRFKGLGEMDPVDIKDTFLSSENQELIQLQYPDDLDKFNEAMTSASMRFDMLKAMGLIIRK